mmetsp:Transcript_107900/g.232389  ORF Transcript_107900/g.232389 Transcript_107900/m.232389 type:complete len:248 (+) Transcript_107900:429-1172(+)
MAWPYCAGDGEAPPSPHWPGCCGPTLAAPLGCWGLPPCHSVAPAAPGPCIAALPRPLPLLLRAPRFRGPLGCSPASPSAPSAAPALWPGCAAWTWGPWGSSSASRCSWRPWPRGLPAGTWAPAAFASLPGTAAEAAGAAVATGPLGFLPTAAGWPPAGARPASPEGFAYTSIFRGGPPPITSSRPSRLPAVLEISSMLSGPRRAMVGVSACAPMLGPRVGLPRRRCICRALTRSCRTLPSRRSWCAV